MLKYLRLVRCVGEHKSNTLYTHLCQIIQIPRQQLHGHVSTDYCPPPHHHGPQSCSPTKISQLVLIILDENILRLDIQMNHTALMDEIQRQ